MENRIIGDVYNELRDNLDCVKIISNFRTGDLSDKQLIKGIEEIVRCWDRKGRVYTREENIELFNYLENLCKCREIKFDRLGVGNINMSVTVYKFIKNNSLIHDFTIVDRM